MIVSDTVASGGLSLSRFLKIHRWPPLVAGTLPRIRPDAPLVSPGAFPEPP